VRDVCIWEVRDLAFSKTNDRAVRVVQSQETWTETKIVGGKRTTVPKESNWLWVATEELDGYGGRPFGT
jgi:hypothetical protein